jgi:hypothetical protein
LVIVNGLVLEFGFDLESEVSIGDEIRNENKLLVGTIMSKTRNSLTLNAVANVVKEICFLPKPQPRVQEYRFNASQSNTI